jgi:hypothetical protein
MQPGTAARVPKSKTTTFDRSGHTQTFHPRPLALIATLKASLQTATNPRRTTRKTTAKVPAMMNAI